MYCVIQEIKLKKQQKHGYSKELVSKYMEASFQGRDISHWTYYFGYEYYERPIRKAYKISIHISKRVNGNVKKEQYVLCTVNYYDFALGWFSPYDYCSGKIESLAKEIGVSEESIYKLIEAKVCPLESSIKEEFMQTDEYITHKKHEHIIAMYVLNKTKFNQKYGLDGDEYDRCYDVYGTLHNSEYLEKIKADYKARNEYEKRSSSYHEYGYSNYKESDYSDYSSYYNNKSSNYCAEDKETLKQFYRALSKKFHPDANPDKDTSSEMKLLNQLKNQWGV